MTQRRRFFPIAPVQTLPGRSVELSLQLKPLVPPAPAPAATGGAVACTGWLVPALWNAPLAGYEVESLPGGRTEMRGVYDAATDIDYAGLVLAAWTGAPGLFDSLGRARPVPTDGFICTEAEVETTYYRQFPGRTFIALAPGCTWVAAWGTPFVEDPTVSSPSLHRFTAVGGTLLLELSDTDTSLDLVETLTATASAGGEPVAQLIFRAVRIAT